MVNESAIFEVVGSAADEASAVFAMPDHGGGTFAEGVSVAVRKRPAGVDTKSFDEVIGAVDGNVDASGEFLSGAFFDAVNDGEIFEDVVIPEDLDVAHPVALVIAILGNVDGDAGEVIDAL